MKCSVEYFEKSDGSTRWVCTRYLLGTSRNGHSLDKTTCYVHNCPGRRPYREIPKLIDKKAPIKSRVCATVACSAELSRDNPQAIYCSEACRIREKSRRYRERRRASEHNGL